jgi:hypothetical protein
VATALAFLCAAATALLAIGCLCPSAQAGTWSYQYQMTIAGTPGTNAVDGMADYTDGEFRNGLSNNPNGINPSVGWLGSIDDSGFTASEIRTDVGQATMELGMLPYNQPPSGPDVLYWGNAPSTGANMMLEVCCTLTYTPSGPADTLPARIPVSENFSASGLARSDATAVIPIDNADLSFYQIYLPQPLVHVSVSDGNSGDPTNGGSGGYEAQADQGGTDVVFASTSRQADGTYQVAMPVRTLMATVGVIGGPWQSCVLPNYIDDRVNGDTSAPTWYATQILLYYTATPYGGGVQLPYTLGRTVGDNAAGKVDPSFTRWLPLAFSPEVHTQQFRTATNPPSAFGPLPGPWGNAFCTYSIALRADINPDVPNAAAISNSFSESAPITANGAYFIPAYSITDVNGDRPGVRCEPERLLRHPVAAHQHRRRTGAYQRRSARRAEGARRLLLHVRAHLDLRPNDPFTAGLDPG